MASASSPFCHGLPLAQRQPHVALPGRWRSSTTAQPRHKSLLDLSQISRQRGCTDLRAGGCAGTAPFPAGTAPTSPGLEGDSQRSALAGGRMLSARTQGTVPPQGGHNLPEEEEHSSRRGTAQVTLNTHTPEGIPPLFHAGAMWHRRNTANAFFPLQCFSLREKGGLHPAKSRLPRTETSLLTFKRKIPGEIRACFPTLCFSAEQLPSRHPAGGTQAASRGLCRQNGGRGSRALFQLLTFLLPGFNLTA